MFLKQVMELRPTIDNLEEVDSDVTEQEEPAAESTLTESPCLLTEDSMQASTSSPIASGEVTPWGARRKRRSVAVGNRAVLESHILDYFKKKSSAESPEETFLRSLTPHLTCLPEDRRLRVQGAMIAMLEAAKPPNDPRPILRAIDLWRLHNDEQADGGEQ